MKLMDASEIKRWDRFTIEREPISSLYLMERAAEVFVDWFTKQAEFSKRHVIIFCGNGNNGGDGLAIARLLRDRFYEVSVVIVGFANSTSEDFSTNQFKLEKYGDTKIENFEIDKIYSLKDTIVIDALLGIGTNREVSGPLKKCIENINGGHAYKIVSIDVPSGLPSEGIGTGLAIKSDVTFTFQVPKLSFFLRENQPYINQWIVGDIGLHHDYMVDLKSSIYLIDENLVSNRYKVRSRFQHKGDFGHVGMIAGSKGMIGAAILSVKAALKSGAGLVTAFVPASSTNVIYASIPEVMVKESGDQYFENIDFIDTEKVTIGVGPGLGTIKSTIEALGNLLKNYKKPMIIDADALNMISQHPSFLNLIPQNSILTPHPKEFERLFGSFNDSQEMAELQIQKSIEHKVHIVLKGAFTRISTPDGSCYINQSGNPGMATAGSGDVLTGIITGLLAQQYSPCEAAILGVYLHGLAGDLALDSESEESLSASDIISHLGKAFKTLNH